MRSVFFLLGGALIVIVMGVPAEFPAQSGSAKSALPYFVYWLLSALEGWGGKYSIVALGVGFIGLAFLLPPKKSKDR
ncbi:hypothetical protein [Variovorax paradoxus]|uniref:hypothetical protein n=1 Tax=Variovorax paradoxus TaxID=34073 RepID=UPI003ECC997E